MPDYTGEYYLRGVMETACGFKINADHSFEFFFMYGALDRTGSGQWKEIEENTIELNSAASEVPSFSIKKESRASHPNIQLRVDNFQQPLLRYTRIVALPGNDSEGVEANAKGDFIIEQTRADKFIVTCYMYGDNPAEIIPVKKDSNHFVLQANSSIILVRFNKLHLKLKENFLEGKVPEILDPVKMFRFEK